MFGSDLLGEFGVANDEFELNLEQLREIAANSLEASFLPAERKVGLLKTLS
jgi:adenosine deaminase/aminodeoxyfutalosine deaminase